MIRFLIQHGTEKTIKIILSFPTTYLCEVRLFFIYFNQNNIKAETRIPMKADTRTLLSSLNQMLKRFVKTVKLNATLLI